MARRQAAAAPQPHRLATLALVLGLMVAAVTLRLYGISSESLWLDEATSLMLARMSVPELAQWTALDIHPPLYYTLLHFWINLGQSEMVVRGLSALAGVINVGVIFELGRAWFGRRTGLIAGALLVAAPFHIWYSQEARMYAWVTLWVSASLLLAFKAWQGRGWWAWVGYVLTAAAGLYTHYYAVYGILLANLFFLYLLVRRRLNARLFWGWVAAEVAVFILFLPWFPTFLLPITVGGGGWIAMSGAGRPSVAVLAQTAVLYMVGPAREFYPAMIRRAAYGLFVATLLAGLWPWRRAEGNPEGAPPPLFSETEAIVFCLAYFVLPLGSAWLASQVFKPMYSARYMLPFLVPFLLLVARGVSHIPWLAPRAAVLVALLAVMGVGIEAQVRTFDKPDWRGLAKQLTEQARPDDLVLFMPGWHAKPFDYYAQGALPVCSDVPIPISQYGDEALEAVGKAVAGHPRIWFVWEQGHYTDPQGQVYGYLQAHCREVAATPLPLVGQIVLFENTGGR